MLIVEDSPDDEMLILRALRRTSIAMNLVVVRDGAEAFEYLQGTASAIPAGGHPDGVVTDLKLPRMSGLDLLRNVRGEPRTARLPVIVFSSSSEDADIAEAYRSGANSYIRKPVNSQAFVDVVSNLAWYWLRVNERLRSTP